MPGGSPPYAKVGLAVRVFPKNEYSLLRLAKHLQRSSLAVQLPTAEWKVPGSNLGSNLGSPDSL